MNLPIWSYIRALTALRIVIEREADRFAFAFLMPKESFMDEVFAVTLDGLLQLKKRWRVSVAAMICRCKDLGFLIEYQSTYLWKPINHRNWRFKEPFDNDFPVECAEQRMQDIVGATPTRKG